MTTHRDFFRGFLVQLDLPVRVQALRALAVVSYFESDKGDNHWNNPLACTQPYPHATAFNWRPDGTPLVWRYRTPHDGEVASAELYSGSHWARVRSAFRYAATRNEVLEAFEYCYNQPFGWVEPPGLDFTGSGWNNLEDIKRRLDHELQPYAPKDPWQ